jgi:hypothetical protein
MIKALKKLGIEGTYLNIIKTIYDKPKAIIIIHGKNLKQFLLKSGKNRVSTFPTLIKYNFGISWQSNKGRKK